MRLQTFLRTIEASLGGAWLGLAATLAVMLPAQATAAEGPTYKYRDSEGTVWLTDRPASGVQIPQMDFIGYHGRPPARVSCLDLGDNERRQRAEAVATPLAEYAERFDVDYDLARAIVAVESCFDPNAVSPVGAQGLMQLMPTTAEALGVRDSFDVHQNLRGGIEYFQRLYHRYNGDIVLALAAYNAGPGAVDRHGGIPPYRETENYIDRVLDHWNTHRDERLQ